MPKYNQPRKTWRYPNNFKVKAVQLSMLDGVQVQAVARTQERLEVLEEVYKAEEQIASGAGISHQDAKSLVLSRLSR